MGEHSGYKDKLVIGSLVKFYQTQWKELTPQHGGHQEEDAVNEGGEGQCM